MKNETEKALTETQEDIKNRNFITENVQAHVSRISENHMKKLPKKTTTTQVNVPWDIWATFTAIIKIKRQSKNAVFSEILRKYNDKNKGALS